MGLGDGWGHIIILFSDTVTGANWLTGNCKVHYLVLLSKTTTTVLLVTTLLVALSATGRAKATGTTVVRMLRTEEEPVCHPSHTRSYYCLTYPNKVTTTSVPTAKRRRSIPVVA